MRATAIVVLVTLVLVGVGLAGLMFVSARSAENGCTAEADRLGASSISGYEWSWSPLGTSCTFDGRLTRTRLFW